MKTQVESPNNGLRYEATADGNVMLCHSSSGHTYTVRFVGRPEFGNEHVATWDCDCPAGVHGRTCKHVHNVPDYEDLSE